MSRDFISLLRCKLYSSAFRYKLHYGSSKSVFLFALFVSDYMSCVPTCQPYVKTVRPWFW